ncbi:hypothetical protein Bbelb_343560 [Branchiostoma belcheri]|nr:hypothetical protein Bbelb_343560 [Branchiostoma belcheri]
MEDEEREICLEITGYTLSDKDHDATHRELLLLPTQQRATELGGTNTHAILLNHLVFTPLLHRDSTGWYEHPQIELGGTSIHVILLNRLVFTPLPCRDSTGRYERAIVA